jgi:hypothetical protein
MSKEVIMIRANFSPFSNAGHSNLFTWDSGTEI